MPGAESAAGRPERLLVVVGVVHEARRLARSRRRGGLGADLRVLPVGAGGRSLARLDEAVGRWRPDAVLATGLAGGLAPSLQPGDLVLGDLVGPTAEGLWLAPDRGLRTRAAQALASSGLRHRTGRLLTAPAVVATPRAKQALHAADGALAVDLESAVVMTWAAGAGLPALAVRAVADGPEETLPLEVAAATGPDGRVRPGVVLTWLWQPAMARAAWRLARRSETALASLGRFLDAFTRAPVVP